MVFNYYNRLSANNKRVYLLSDGIETIALPDPAPLRPVAARLQSALGADQRPLVEAVCGELAVGMLQQLKTPPVNIKVMAARPSNDYGELHGFYEGVEGALKVAKITLWMRTAQKKRVVAFKSFLRTFLHELCHHLDYEYLKLADSFHTQGFYQRESSLFHQLVDAPCTPGFPANGSAP
ncbi:MAG: hypothetical protein KGL98_05680 [Gammaproteobacteria bacterium]|nr:hypothetical protein [Gammaproteobacteria bacterium]MDE1984236.1 hypothetical protein [Gammaproteobacteria bacterium]MDE2460720.1 hypothetical protein [Gammaproteobacteria bacterium]